jgi:uncharacterized membrane protein YkoI
MRHVTLSVVVLSAQTTLVPAADTRSSHGPSREQPVLIESLPASVQRAVKDQAGDGQIVALSQDHQAGRTTYEATFRTGAHSKDVEFDADGNVLSAEEPIALDAIPDSARRAVEQAALGGKIVKVEVVTEKGATSYEAEIRKGRHVTEIRVDADGRPVRK